MIHREMRRAAELATDLYREKPILGLVGQFQLGKSTLLNCLLGRYAALTGQGLATTVLTARYRWGEQSRLRFRNRKGKLEDTTIAEIHQGEFMDRVRLHGGFHIEANEDCDLLKICDLVDTPGFNANPVDSEIALSVLEEMHYLIFVMENKEFQNHEKALILKLFQWKIPILFVMNCRQGRREERWMPEHPLNERVRLANESWLYSTGYPLDKIGGRTIHPCNFLFYWFYQPEYDQSASYIDRPDTIGRHIRDVFEDQSIPFSQETVIGKSGVPQLMSYLMQRIGEYRPIDHTWR